jgi:hypothetical protein
MEYKFLFLISSSIEHFSEEDFSRFNSEERFLQTLDTIKSVRQKVPNAYICLFECSHKPIHQNYKKSLKEKVDLFLELHDDLVIKLLYENLNNNKSLLVFGKSLLETRGLLCTLEYFNQNKIFNNFDRVFKLSGRYILNDDFNIQDYETKLLKNYYVIKTFEYPKIENDIMDDVNYKNLYAFIYKSKGSMVTGLWSFDISLFEQTVDALLKSFDYMQKMITFTPGIDIEHSLYYYLDKKKIIKSYNLGLHVIKGMENSNYNI